MAVPKPTSPDYYWVIVATELFNLALPNLDLAETLKALTFYEDVILYHVEAFCAADQPLYIDLTIEDFEDETYLFKLRNAALQTVYYNLCEEP